MKLHSLSFMFLFLVCFTVSAQETGRNDCPDAQKIFGISLKKDSPAGIGVVSTVYDGISAKLAGLLADDELVKVNGKALPLTGWEDILKFLRQQPVTKNDFEIKRKGKTMHLFINRSCLNPGLVGNIDELRNTIVALMKAKSDGFKNFRGAKIKTEKDNITYRTNFRFLTGDTATVTVDNDPQYNHYSVNLGPVIDEATSAKAYAYWQRSVRVMFPDFKEKPSQIDYGFLEHTDFISNTMPNCQISIVRFGVDGKYGIYVQVKGTKEKSIDFTEMLN